MAAPGADTTQQSQQVLASRNMRCVGHMFTQLYASQLVLKNGSATSAQAPRVQRDGLCYLHNKSGMMVQGAAPRITYGSSTTALTF